MAEVLSVDRVGVTDDFFALGGHSLLAAKFISRVKHGFQLTVPLPLLFQEPTVDRLADYIDMTLWAARQRTEPATALQEDEEEIRL
jgi:acyl carrier protein